MSISSTPVTGVGAWFARPNSRDAESLLFCLPYRGGGAAAFQSWSRFLAPAVGVAGIRLPGILGDHFFLRGAAERPAAMFAADLSTTPSIGDPPGASR